MVKTKTEFHIDSLVKAMELCSSEETPDYLLEQAMDVISRADLDPEKRMTTIENLEKFTKLTRLKFVNMSDIWSGKFQPVNPYKNMHDALAKEAAAKLAGKEVMLFIAISDASDFVRGATLDGQEAQPQDYEILDDLVNSYLVTINMKNHNGKIYETDENGVDLQVAESEMVKGFFVNSTYGIEEYASHFSLVVKVQLCAYEAAD